LFAKKRLHRAGNVPRKGQTDIAEIRRIDDGMEFCAEGERKFYAASAQKSGVSLSGSILCNACHQSIWFGLKSMMTNTAPGTGCALGTGFAAARKQSGVILTTT